MTFLDNTPKRVLGVADFPPLGNPKWGTPVEKERRLRIQISVWAFAYEMRNVTIVSDHQFDRFACMVDRNLMTGHPVLDEFFLVHFSPMTGMWIFKHPELEKIEAIYDRYHAKVLKPLGLAA